MEAPVSVPVHSPEGFLRLARHPWKMRLFLMRQLPAAYFSGVCVVSAADDSCSVQVPYRWFTRNPFGSTYFACLAMAAEMSTGLLAMAHVYRRRPGVSMLVTGIDARFLKKATGMTVFTCADGQQIRKAVEAAIATGLPQSVRAKAHGVTASGEGVADFTVEWSFKRRGSA